MIDDKGHGCVRGGGGGIGHPPPFRRTFPPPDGGYFVSRTRLHQIKSNFHVNQGG